MNTSTALIAAALVAAMPLAASAQQANARDSVHFQVNGQPVQVTSVEPTPSMAGYHIDFAQLDRNHDGYISRSEARADPELSAEFNAVDTHHRGRLSKADLKGWIS